MLRTDREGSLRHLFGSLAGDEPDELSRARLRRRVLEALQSPVPAAGGGRWVRTLSWSAAAAAAVLAVVGLVAYRQGGSAGSEPTLSIQANGGIHLKWNDVGKGRYRVLKSTSPADFTKATAATVRGTAYVDREAVEAPVVYYRVE